jgi:predicted nucleic acid-binding protein
VSELAIFDTSILIDQLRSDRHTERIERLHCVIRYSSVVLAELWRGATKSEEQQFLGGMAKSKQILTPTANNWIESGQILARIQKDHGFEPKKLREMHFDVLIALTARSNGARLITSNRADFELIREYRGFELEVW